MKFLCLLSLAAGAFAAQLPDVRSVYLLPMRGGLDQFLAARLTGEHVLPVVADPRLADAVLTDHLGAGFEQQLSAMRARFDKVDAKAEEKGDAKPELPKPDAARPPISSFGRGRGTVFLVDVKTRQVLWSAYDKPRGSSPDAMQRTAKRVVAGIEKALDTRN